MKGGVHLGYIRVSDGAVEDLVHIDVIVSPREPLIIAKSSCMQLASPEVHQAC